MAWSRGRSAAALAVGVLSALGNAQALYGGDQSSCGPTEDFVNIGCFLGDQTFLTPFDPTNYNPADPSNSYPGFDSGTNFNATVTPQICVTTCRGYGFRTAALLNGACSCGYGLPAVYPPVVAGSCAVPCIGDSSQTCGGATDTQLYIDPSFADPNQLSGAAPADVAAYYEYLGCFHQDASFPTGDPANTVSTQATVEGCLANCALLRYPLANAVPLAGGGVTCNCGETFDFNDFRVREGEETPVGSCSTDCVTGVIDTCDPTQGTCCGGNNYYPVYINPELEGCYVPSIPGYGLVNALNEPTAFVCADVAASLTNGPNVYTRTSYPALDKVTATPLPTHPVSVLGTVNQVPFYEYGCFAAVPPLVLIGLTTPSVVTVTLETCADACSTFAFFGITNGDTCYCGTDIGSAPLVAFDSCNVRCTGDAQELCGGSSAVEVYAISARWNNEVAQSIQATVLENPNPATACVSSTSTTSTTTTTSDTTTSTSTSETSTETSTSESTTETSTSETSTSETSTTETSTSETSTSETSTSETSTSETSTTDSSTSTTDTATSTSQTVTPTQPPEGNSYIFQVQIISGDLTQQRKRQVVVDNGAGFVGAAGPVNPSTCTLATPFDFVNGTLSSGGEFVSTDPGIAYQPFWTTPTNGSILGTFALQNNVLVWSNDAFANTLADFCRDDSGQVYVIFDGNAPPFTCTAVQLVVYQAEACQNGTLVTSTTSSMTSTSTSVTISTSTDSTATTTDSSTTGTDSSTTSTESSTSTSETTVPTAPSTNATYIFGVIPTGADAIARRAIEKRQFAGGNGFVGAAGPVNPTDCSLATPFRFIDGTLSSGGQLISTDPGIAYQPFWVNPTVGAIYTTFALQNGLLVWYNPAFVGVFADFCQDDSGQVWVVFDGVPLQFPNAPTARSSQAPRPRPRRPILRSPSRPSPPPPPVLAALAHAWPTAP
ncbi:hypothetical protein BR93DRAFT_604335 [Coniochaeta sp. PMI_546]|nr:hypothetical protein BR93DRAFT_604335 [Coniochaeta sp. PMI_546]